MSELLSDLVSIIGVLSCLFCLYLYGAFLEEAHEYEHGDRPRHPAFSMLSLLLFPPFVLEFLGMMARFFVRSLRLWVFCPAKSYFWLLVALQRVMENGLRSQKRREPTSESSGCSPSSTTQSG